MDDAHRLDAMFLVGGQALFDRAGLYAMAPTRRVRQMLVTALPAQDFGRKSQPSGQPRPERGEMAGLIHHDVIAGTEEIDQRSFPSARAR